MSERPDATDERFTPDNAAMLLIDYQTGLLQGIRTQEPTPLKNNVVALAEVAKLYDVPVILTTADAEGPNGPLLPELRDLFPEVEVIDRSLVNAWDDPRVVAAVEETGRENLIVSGIAMEVCLTFPAESASRDGYDVQAVLDASGAINHYGEQAALWRMQDADVTPTTYNGILSELLYDWATEEGPEQARQFGEFRPFYGYLMDSYGNAAD